VYSGNICIANQGPKFALIRLRLVRLVHNHGYPSGYYLSIHSRSNTHTTQSTQSNHTHLVIHITPSPSQHKTLPVPNTINLTHRSEPPTLEYTRHLSHPLHPFSLITFLRTRRTQRIATRMPIPISPLHHTLVAFVEWRVPEAQPLLLATRANIV
jgi:hypothetical protein